MEPMLGRREGLWLAEWLSVLAGACCLFVLMYMATDSSQPIPSGLGWWFVASVFFFIVALAIGVLLYRHRRRRDAPAAQHGVSGLFPLAGESLP
jgi:amino acid permease